MSQKDPKITPEDLRIIRSNNLDEELVQITLAGYLSQELRNIHGIKSVSAEQLLVAISTYSVCIKTQLLGTAVEMHEAGVRPKGWKGTTES